MIGLHYYTKYTKEKIKLSAKPFAGGGEGNLYKIASPRSLSHLVAKIYHPQKRNKIREQKLTYLMKNPPKGYIIDGHPNIIWVTDVIYEENSRAFAGILMPMAEGVKLENFTSSRLPKYLGADWDRFRFQHPEALKIRLKTAFNIAAAIHLVHQKERYVLVDLKPDNILIQNNGLISLVDMDSIEVVENGRSIYDAPVATPEFIPPEHYRKSELDYNPTTQKTWDLFALSAILYKLFLGIHPYAASARPPYDRLVSLEEKIKEGLFVHHPSKQDLFFIIPPPHKAFFDLDERVRDLFYHCFVHGQDEPPKRPTADQWCNVLSSVLGMNREQTFVRVLPKLEIPLEHQAMYDRLGTTHVFVAPNVQQIQTPALVSKEAASIDSINEAKNQYLDSIRPIKKNTLLTIMSLSMTFTSVTVFMFYFFGNMLLLGALSFLSFPIFVLLGIVISYFRHGKPHLTEIREKTVSTAKNLKKTHGQLLELPPKFVQYQSTFDRLGEINQFIQQKQDCKEQLGELQITLDRTFKEEKDAFLQLEAKYYKQIEENKVLKALDNHDFNQLQSKLQQKLNELELFGNLVDENKLQELEELELKGNQDFVNELHQQLEQIFKHHEPYYIQKKLELEAYPKSKIDQLTENVFTIVSPSTWLKQNNSLASKHALEIPLLLEQRQELQTKIKLYFAGTDHFFIDFLKIYEQFKGILREHEEAKGKKVEEDKTIKTDQWESFADRMRRKHQQNLLKQALLKQQQENPQLISQLEKKLQTRFDNFQQDFQDFLSTLQELNLIHTYFLQLIKGNESNRTQQLTQIKNALSFLKDSQAKQINAIRSEQDIVVFKTMIAESLEYLQQIHDKYKTGKEELQKTFDQRFSAILSRADGIVELLLERFKKLDLSLLENQEVSDLKQLVKETNELKGRYKKQGVDLMELKGQEAWEKQKSFGFWMKTLFSKLPPTE